MPADNRLLRDFHNLMKNIASFSNGQAAVTHWDDENMEIFEVTISPNDGPYKDGEFLFQIDASAYPSGSVRVCCKTAIYHPNIDTIDDPEGEICLNLFDADVWNEDCTLEDVVQGLLFLFYHPNLEDPLCCHISCSMSQAEFEENVLISLAGGTIDDTFIYPANEGYLRKHPEAEKGQEDGVEASSAVVAIETEDGGSVGEGQEERKTEERKDMKTASSEGDSEDAVEGTSDSKRQNIITCHFGIQQILTDDDDAMDEEEEEDAEEDEDVDSFEDEEQEDDEEGEDSNRTALNHGGTGDSEQEKSADNGEGYLHLDDSSDVVSDEDLQLIIDLLDENGEDNNVDSEGGSEPSLAWSRIVYGSKSNNCTDGASPSQVPVECVCTIADTPTNSRRIQRGSTVVTRFFCALQTRNFRRWLV